MQEKSAQHHAASSIEQHFAARPNLPPLGTTVLAAGAKAQGLGDLPGNLTSKIFKPIDLSQ